MAQLKLHIWDEWEDRMDPLGGVELEYTAEDVAILIEGNMEEPEEWGVTYVQAAGFHFEFLDWPYALSEEELAKLMEMSCEMSWL